MEMTGSGMTWKEVAAELVSDFMAWGCRFDRKKLPEIAMGYDCSELFFWNWMDNETPRSETGFLRVLGYAWRKHLREEEETVAPAERPARKAATVREAA